MGNLFSDNPKYLCLYLLEHTNFEITWIGNDVVRDCLPNHKRLKFARKGGFKAFFALMRASVWVCCQAWNIDLTRLPIKGFATIIDTWHGIPVKQIGLNTADARKARKLSWLKKLLIRIQYEEDEWLLVSSDQMARILTSGVPNRYSMNRILRCGTPRNDFLLKNYNNKEFVSHLKEKYAKLLGIDKAKKIILYLPTWRKRGDCVFAFYNQDDAVQLKWRDMFDQHNSVLIEKHHYDTYAIYPMTNQSLCSMVITAEQQKSIDVQELLLIADLLISDYSGAYVDYALMQRPVIHFVYDLEDYAKQDSGFAYNFESVVAGPMARTLDELRILIGEQLTIPDLVPAQDFGELVSYEHGSSCEQIMDFILKTNYKEMR